MSNRLAIVEDVRRSLDARRPGNGMTVAILDIDGVHRDQRGARPRQRRPLPASRRRDRRRRGGRQRLHRPHRRRPVRRSHAQRRGAGHRRGARPHPRARCSTSSSSTGSRCTAEITVGRVEGDATRRRAELLRRAGVACRAAKQANAPLRSLRARQEGFDADRLTLVAELRHAIDDGQLVLHYQPKVDAADGVVDERRGAGALAAPGRAVSSRRARSCPPRSRPS